MFPEVALAAIRQPVGAAIFDMDGLLVDTGPIWRTVGNGLFASLGVDISALAASGVAKGMSVRDAMAVFRAYAGWGPADHADLEEQVVAEMVAAIRAGAALKPGAMVALELCDRYRLPAAIASGSTRPIIDAVLDHFDLSDRFAAVCSAADETWGKPHPAIFLRAAAELGVAPTACLVVEDALPGCIAAKAASMRVVAVPDGACVGDPRFAIADAVLGSLEDLCTPGVLEALGLPATPPRAAPAGSVAPEAGSVGPTR